MGTTGLRGDFAVRVLETTDRAHPARVSKSGNQLRHVAERTDPPDDQDLVQTMRDIKEYLAREYVQTSGG